VDAAKETALCIGGVRNDWVGVGVGVGERLPHRNIVLYEGRGGGDRYHPRITSDVTALYCQI
jgi:hypothetical protein